MAESDVYCNVVMNLDEFIYVLLLILTCPSFLSPGTFSLLKLPTLWWGTLIIKMKSYLLEVYIRFYQTLSI